ncbi:hypothetical protein GCM10027168_16600 [Streptomyces capparidis]
MARPGSPPADRASAPAAIWALPPLTAALSAAVAVAAVGEAARGPVAVLGAVAVLAVGVAARATAGRDRAVAELRREHTLREAALTDRLAAHDAELTRIARDLLPGAADRLRRGDCSRRVLRDVLREARRHEAFGPGHVAVLKAAVEHLAEEAELRDASRRAVVSMIRRVQSIVHQQARDLRDMEYRHGFEQGFFDDLLHLDHGNALVGRLADGIAVLGGDRPGRRWTRDVPLYNVLRGAKSRILEYRRVTLHSVPEVAVKGPSVEPVIHAVAELLDNATRYSPPQARVHLTASEVRSGVAIEIEDGGAGLDDDDRRRIGALLDGSATGRDLTAMGESPRLGLSVVARLARRHGFRISLRASAYGGVRAVVVVPEDVIAEGHAPPRLVSGLTVSQVVRRAGETRSPSRLPPMPALFHDGSDSDIVVERDADGLPRRRRRSPSSAERVAASRRAGAATAAPAEEAGLAGREGEQRAGAEPLPYDVEGVLDDGLPGSPSWEATRRAPGGEGGGAPGAVFGADFGAGAREGGSGAPGVWLGAFYDAVGGGSAGPGAGGGGSPDGPPGGTPDSTDHGPADKRDEK